MGVLKEFRDKNKTDSKPSRFKDFDQDISKMGNGKKFFKEE